MVSKIRVNQIQSLKHNDLSEADGTSEQQTDRSGTQHEAIAKGMAYVRIEQHLGFIVNQHCSFKASRTQKGVMSFNGLGYIQEK